MGYAYYWVDRKRPATKVAEAVVNPKTGIINILRVSKERLDEFQYGRISDAIVALVEDAWLAEYRRSPRSTTAFLDGMKAVLQELDYLFEEDTDDTRRKARVLLQQ